MMSFDGHKLLVNEPKAHLSVPGRCAKINAAIMAHTANLRAIFKYNKFIYCSEIKM